MGRRRSGLQRSFPVGDRAFVISRPRSKRRFLIPHRLAELTLLSPPKPAVGLPSREIFSASCSETRKIVKNALNSRRFDWSC